MDSNHPPSAPGNFFGTFGVKFYRFRMAVRRHWWVLFLAISLGLAYQAWQVFKKPDLFESSSQLNIREELNMEEMRKFRQQDDRDFAGTTLQMLRSPVIVERARLRLMLGGHGPGSTPPEITTGILPRTTIFLVNGTGTNPEYTQLFVDAVVDEFIAFKREQRDNTLSTATLGLGKSEERLRRELDEQKAKLKTFVEENNMPLWAEQGRQSAEFLSELKTREAQLQTELQRLENLTPEQLLTAPPAGTRPRDPATPEADTGAPATIGSELYAQYLQTFQQLIQRKAELAERSRVWKPKHPKLQAIKDDVTRLERLIEVIKEQNNNASTARATAIRAELKSLATSIADWNGKVMEANSKDATFQTLQADVNRTQALLEKLLTSAGAVNAGTVMDPLIVLQKASAPVPVPKETIRHLVTGLLTGLLVGLLIVVLLDRADDRLASSSEVLQHFTEPILGQIPDVVESRGPAGLPLLHADDERYTYAEAFRSLRSSLVFMPNQSELRTLLVTSAIPNEGKSTIATNLAITMAASGARTLLVDADLRRGDLASLFAVEGERGLSDVLRGDLLWKEAVQKTRFEGLSLMHRGAVTNQSGELLLKPIVATLLEEMKAAYDLVIFNTAPILATDDTPTLAPNFDGTLMIVRAQFTSAKLTQNALGTLYQRQVNVLGLILNCVNTDMPDYYYYRYPKYYAA